jgi:hypothetical protein
MVKMVVPLPSLVVVEVMEVQEEGVVELQVQKTQLT